MELNEKVVVITGGSKGLGKALAHLFVKEKSNVVIGSNEENDLQETANELGVQCFKVDVRDQGEVRAFAKDVLEAHGRIDLWVNNAGIQIKPSLMEDVKVEKLRNLFDINFYGYFYGFQEAIKIMKKQGFGAILSINSKAGLTGYPELSAYSASKFAITGLTQSIRSEIADTGIKIFSVHPGGIKTELYKEEYPVEFENYMSPEYTAEIIINNLKSNNPVMDLTINRPTT